MVQHGFKWKLMVLNQNDIYNDPNLAIYHGQDFLKYRIHRMNVGPFGFSPHTETQDPIILPFKLLQTQKIRPRKSFSI